MLRLLPFIIALLLGAKTYSQLNMTQLGELDIPAIHETKLNDIWGYVDGDGNEYALVGAEDGVSIVDISNPFAPNEVSWIPGLNSVWRDLKTYGDYAYVTTEALEGLKIIDLSGLPGDADLPVSIYDGPETATWQSAHNLYQTDGYVYIFGAGRGNGGVIILDVATDPMNPIEVGVFDDWYAHDGFVVGDIGYFAHIYEGFFSIVDLSDKSSPVLLGTAITPTNFAHNIWASEDGNYVFTTDEVSGGYIGAFDVTDPSFIQEVDRIQSSPGNGIVPHNSHVKGDYLYTSYYTDGVVIHDITNPDNMIEVANYDTSPLTSGDTKGCWGVYPFLPSGNIIASDREEGFFIYSVDEHQGSYLVGNVTELGSGMNLNNVQITVDGTEVSDLTNVVGDYATGVEAEGMMDVTYFKVLYFPQTISVPFANAATVEQDVILEKIPEFSVNVRVLDSETMDPIEGVEILIEHTFVDHSGVTEADGGAEIPLYYQDNYQLYAGKWGYKTICLSDTMITNETTEIVVLLDKGIMDDFTFDFGWETSATAVRGFWEREIPVGVMSGEDVVQNPFNDIGFDCGEYAFMTGNGTSASDTEEVNGGEVVLISPVFDVSDMESPHVNYSAWFFCRFGPFAPDDTLQIYLMNGLGDVVLIDEYYNGGLPMSQWHSTSIAIEPVITPTENMQLLVKLSDFMETVNVTEGAIDNFSVTNTSLLGEVSDSKIEEDISVYPNPFNQTVTVNGVEEGWLTIFDISGREIAHLPIQKQISLAEMERGTYFFVISDALGNKLDVFTQIKN